MILRIHRVRLALRNFGPGVAGNTAIEVALILPILAFLLMGAVDFGFAYHRKLDLADAARAGVQFAADNYNDLEDLSTAVRSRLEESGILESTAGGHGVSTSARSYCTCGDSEVSCSSTCGSGALPNRYVEVLLAQEFDLLFDYPYVDQPVAIDESATMRVE